MRVMPAGRKGLALALSVFGSLVLVGMLVLLSQTQLNLPFFGPGQLYEVSVTVKDADNLVTGGEVRIAGVPVGNVMSERAEPGGMVAVLGIGRRYAPLHEGLTVRVGNRSLVEETYLGIQDGNGPAIPDGAALPSGSVQGSTQIRDILYSLDPKTRQTLATVLRSAGAATSGTQRQVSQLFSGLGDVGQDGGTTLTALDAQGDDLRQLAAETTTVLRALDTGQGEIATLVDNTNRLTEATQQRRSAVEATVQRLPGVLDSAYTTSDSVRNLSAALRPVAQGLRDAAPQLRDAMGNLPRVTQDLRRLMPDLETSLHRAPDTLTRVNTFSHDLRDDLVPDMRDILQDVNPMLGYLKNYGPEVGGFISNFGAIMGYTDEAGRETYHVMITGTDAAVETPVNTGNIGHMDYYNPIPAPGTLGAPGPFKGTFPRLEREPR